MTDPNTLGGRFFLPEDERALACFSGLWDDGGQLADFSFLVVVLLRCREGREMETGLSDFESLWDRPLYVG